MAPGEHEPSGKTVPLTSASTSYVSPFLPNPGCVFLSGATIQILAFFRVGLVSLQSEQTPSTSGF